MLDETVMFASPVYDASFEDYCLVSRRIAFSLYTRMILHPACCFAVSSANDCCADSHMLTKSRIRLSLQPNTQWFALVL